MSNLFKPGKITVCLDGGAGSSAKGSRGANIWKYYKEKHTKFVVNTFMENAAHTITTEDKEYIYQCLSSISMLDYEKQYIGPGAVFAEKTILKEIADHKLTSEKLGIHPNVAIVTQIDVDYEKGLVDFEGNKKVEHSSANLKIGSTLHGVGAARARRVLRRPDAVIAKMVPTLNPFICNTHEEILGRLQNGESSLGEIAQGWQLSLFSEFWPKVTSRNCSVPAFLDDTLLPMTVVGPVVVNFRTFPIRVNNNKYIRISDGKILTWDEFNSTPESDRKIIKGDSGGCYQDQQEITWDDVSRECGEKIFECTSLTKLPRRCYSFSTLNMIKSLIYNNSGDDVYISVNFMNYVDASVKGKRTIDEVLTPKVLTWIKKYIWNNNNLSTLDKAGVRIKGMFIGTWKTIDDSVFIDRNELTSAYRYTCE